MDKYTIYCTEEQVRQVIELGAPIKLFCKDYMYGHINYMGSPIPIGHVWIHNDLYYTPTAEQMIGWLEEQDIFVSINHISEGYSSWLKTISTNENISGNLGYVSSRKEAILASIDAALEYLKAIKQ